MKKTIYILTCLWLMGTLTAAALAGTQCRIAPKLALDHSDVQLEALIDKDSLALLGSGKDIIVAVIDTGLDLDNSWISATLHQNIGEIPGDNADNDMNGYVDDVTGWNFGDNDNMVQDLHGHGTQVASIIRLLAPEAGILPIKVTTGASDSFDADLAAQAILYAVDAGADIINMSFTAQQNDIAIEDALKKAAEEGILLVGAAGNSGGTVEFPALEESVIAVGSAASDLTPSWFSPSGDTLDLLAPGEGIEVTGLDGEVQFVSGTSFSAPSVSAAAAVVLSMNLALKAETVKNLLFKSAQDILAPGVDDISGYGFLNGATLYSEATPSVYPLSTSTPLVMNLGIHIPPTDTQARLYIAVEWNNDLFWLTSQGNWVNPMTTVGTGFAQFTLPDISTDLIFYGSQGIFPSIMTDKLEPGEYKWLILMTDLNDIPLSPVGTATTEI